MLEQGKELRRAGGPPIPLPALGAILLLAAGAGGYFWWLSQQPPPEDPQLTEEARQYLTHLDLADVEMQAEEDFLEQTLVTIEGKIANHGARTVTLVEINCIFREINGIEIAREPRAIVGGRTGTLDPGGMTSFRLAFDAVSPDWNQAMPSLFISQIQFE